jgi:hypothetical protein
MTYSLDGQAQFPASCRDTTTGQLT